MLSRAKNQKDDRSKTPTNVATSVNKTIHTKQRNKVTLLNIYKRKHMPNYHNQHTLCLYTPLIKLSCYPVK